MKKNSNVGVIIANAEGSFFGYSEKEGFFVSKESFFSLNTQKSLASDIVWFTNQPQKNIKRKNIKSTDYLGVDVEEILSYLGYSLNKKTLKMVLRKYHDFMLMFVNNIFNQFKNTKLESSNQSVAKKRHADREKIFLNAKTYRMALIKIGETFPETFKIEVEENKKNVLYSPKDVYSISKYNEFKKKNQMIDSLLVNKLKEEERKVINKTHSFEYTLLTLNSDRLLSLPDKLFFSQDDYEIVDVESRLKENKDYKNVIAGDSYLFFHVAIKAADGQEKFKNAASFKVLEKLNKKEAIMSMEEYLYFCSSDFLKVKIIKGYRLKQKLMNQRNDYKKTRENLSKHNLNRNINKYNNTFKKMEEIKLKMGFHFQFGLQLFKQTMTEEQHINKLQNHIHTFNYLQIILLNDNFLLNEWIKSQLLYKNIELIEKLLKNGITVSSYDYKSITLNIDYEQKEEVRRLLEKNNMTYPASLL